MTRMEVVLVTFYAAYFGWVIGMRMALRLTVSDSEWGQAWRIMIEKRRNTP